MSTTSTPVYDTYVGVGLEGQDDNIEILQGYFREMQMMTVETSMNTDIDFLTFAMTAQYFGVIMMKEFEEYPGYCPMQVEVEDELPRDLDDEELAVRDLIVSAYFIYHVLWDVGIEHSTTYH